MKNIALIGSTGSIGRQAIEVALARPDEFRIVSMAANSSAELFARQVQRVKPLYCALADESAASKIASAFSDTVIRCGEEAALRAADFGKADIVLVAAGGFAGLKYSLAALNSGKPLALANKETLVCGGDIVMPLAQRKKAEILPVDSEHSAIWQCLGFDARAPFKKIIITASGGAFRDFTEEQLKTVTPQMALRHPTWKMGAKITVDSATLLNKGYEVIEAHHLFGADYSKITAVIHPQSIVHSMVEFEDGAVMAQLSVPTMKLPIQAALTYPRRFDCGARQLDFSEFFSLEFRPLDGGRYPCFKAAAECGKEGGTLPCALNAAGEVAVRAFLSGELAFTDIARVIDGVLQQSVKAPVDSYAALCETDRLSREKAEAMVRRLAV